MRAIRFVDNPSCSQNTNNGRVLMVTVERCIIIIMLVMPLRRVDDRPWHACVHRRHAEVTHNKAVSASSFLHYLYIANCKPLFPKRCDTQLCERKHGL